MMGLLLGTGGDSGKLVLPAMMQDDWGDGRAVHHDSGRRQRDTAAAVHGPGAAGPLEAAGGIAHKPVSAAESVRSWGPRAVAEGLQGRTQHASVSAADQPLAGERRENLRLRRATRIRREVPLPRCHHRLEWVLTFWLALVGFAPYCSRLCGRGHGGHTYRKRESRCQSFPLLIK